MRKVAIGAAILLSFSTASFGREAYVSLADYARRAEAICVCTVEKDDGDKTVTVRVDQALKGALDKTEVLKGETGHCVMHGPVSHFMKPKARFVVFLFKDNTVGRLGGILSVHEDTLVARFVDGFTGTTFDKNLLAHKLPLKNALEQIKAILNQEKNLQPEDSPAKK